jgi:DNA-binding MarR family transcriptional regulator
VTRNGPLRQVLDLYPRIFFACHARHVRDPKTRRLLSAHQASILDHLDPVEPTALMDLARHMGVTPSTMSIAMDRLARRGYVVRTRDPRDGRRSALRTTAAGERIKQAQSVLEPARVAGMLRMLSPRQRFRGLEGLALLGRAADRYMQSGAPKKLYGMTRRQRGGKL